MAISMGAALLGSAIIGGGAAIAGASANSSAINNASNQQNQATQQNLALQKQVYDSNNALLSPYNQRGNAAGEQINALLGLSGASAAPTGGAGGYGQTDWAAYVNNQSDVAANWAQVRGTQADTFGGDAARFGAYHYNADGAHRDLTPYTPQAPAAATPQNAQNAFDVFRNSTGYQFRLDEGNKSLNALNAARGTLDSGAAVKSALQYGQNIGSQEFGNYMGYLGNQQGVGLSGASAVAGVGQNYANNSANINQAGATAQGNLALQRGQNTNDMLGDLASSFGLGMGALTRWGK